MARTAKEQAEFRTLLKDFQDSTGQSFKDFKKNENPLQRLIEQDITKQTPLQRARQAGARKGFTSGLSELIPSVRTGSEELQKEFPEAFGRGGERRNYVVIYFSSWNRGGA